MVLLAGMNSMFGYLWGETAFFVKDVFGPKGSLGIVEPKNDGDILVSDIDSHTKTNQLLIHYQDRDDNGKFKFEDKYTLQNEPNHDELYDLLEILRMQLERILIH